MPKQSMDDNHAERGVAEQKNGWEKGERRLVK
jgi:hypothetical protein